THILSAGSLISNTTTCSFASLITTSTAYHMQVEGLSTGDKVGDVRPRGNLAGNFHRIATATLTVAVREIGTGDTSVEQAPNINLFRFETRAGEAEDILFTKVIFEAASGALQNGQNYALWVDTDGDGVADYLDECSNTPKNVLVDQKGCPVDSDKDGVPDYSDLCPDTPLGISVDDFGCPFDIDVDGIPDYKDKCPDTPTGIAVDDKGCPIDSDLDGIPDYKDNCPDTQHGMMVDSTGCVKIKTQKKKIEKKKEIIKQKKKKIETKIKPKIKTVKKITPKLPKKIKIDYDIFTLSGDNYFRFGKSTLLQTAFPYLNGLVEYMKKNLLSRWWIEGYTDNVGSKEANQKLSLERVKAVLNYFVKKGIVKQRFKVTGLGESFPIASNKTKKGRAKNRRVVIVRTY
ncbi:MAG: OmpA family protein, partial [Bacteroidetes bacterium]|nr:OmpA family protein [Bacteroidota bacterium]